MNTSQHLKILTLITGMSISQCVVGGTNNEKDNDKVAKLDSAFLEYLALTSFDGDEISDPLDMLDVDEESLNANFDQLDKQQGQNEQAEQKKVISKSNSGDDASDLDLQKQKEEK
ncbi:MAG: hypothetical protein OQJ89_10405 [Kangiellaceae bacterium]|nr:hypothetical protein [Kangiellaceae bacterium]MCW8997380.1 hypothetical protein [Kangiellaceae bacterium]MCW9017366.1 hypothetical protein [Kangiellaceae bacterium]